MVFVGIMTTNLHSFKPRSDIFEMLEFPLLYFSLLYNYICPLSVRILQGRSFEPKKGHGFELKDGEV